jgi:hypothetical protein
VLPQNSIIPTEVNNNTSGVSHLTRVEGNPASLITWPADHQDATQTSPPNVGSLGNSSSQPTSSISPPNSSVSIIPFATTT